MRTRTPWRRSVGSLVLLLLPLLLGSGCALTEAYMDLSYSAQQDVTKVGGAKIMPLSVEVSDARTIRDKVSCKKNGYGQEKAAIISK